jgi:bacteriorhodopsin
MSLIAFIWILYTLIVIGTKSTRNKNAQSVSKFYTMIAGYTIIVWIAYPIIWAVSSRRVISVDGEIIAFAVLDILSKIVFGAWLLLAHRRLPEGQSEVNGFWAGGFNPEGQIRIGDGDDA